MALIHDQISEQFYEWERRGRGWKVNDKPVHPEPPFRPFYGHRIKEKPIFDDGRKPTFLSSLVQRISKGLADKAAEVPSEIEDDEPEPEALDRGDIVELFASLPATSNVSKEIFEQFVLSLANCGEPISFELIGTNDSITGQFAASEADIELIRQQLEGHFPEAVFIKQLSFLEEKWNQAEDKAVIFEFGLAREFMLQIASVRNFNIDPFIGIMAALSSLQKNELALFQVIFEPVQQPWGESVVRSVTDSTGKDFFVNRPELAGEAKKKVSRPLFAAVVRIAIKSDERMLDIARDIAGALTVFSNPEGNEFIPLENKDYPFDSHEEDLLRRQSRRCGMILNSDELISLVHLPSASVRSAKFKRDSQRSKAAPKIVVDSTGISLGENHHAGKVNQVRLTTEQRVRHTYVIGASGTGKSTFLFNLIRQDIENGQGVAVLDPHGDLIDKICGCIPEHRIKDVIVLDPSDEQFSIGFNILSAHSDLEKNLLASDLVSVFQRLSTSWGDQMGSVLNNAILAFLESSMGGTLADLRRFLIEPAFRNQFLETVRDPDIVYYWKKAFPTLAGNKSIGSVLTRLDTFLSPKPIRYMVSQKENRLDFSDIMNSGKIFLGKLSQGKMGKENSYLMGSLLVAKFQQAAMGRANLLEKERRNFWLYIDEFHNFITPSMAEILTGARKYRVGLILAHQELRQLQRDSDVASAVLSQSYTRVCFRVGDDDARKLCDGFGFFEAQDLQSLPNFEAICRVERADCDFNLAVPFPKELDEAEAAEVRKQVITSSRNKYSVSREQIETELAKARAGTEAAKPNEKTTQTEVTPKTVATILEPIPEVKIEVVEQVIASSPVGETTPTPVVEIERAPDKGIGGHQHNLIRERIESAGSQLGYSTSREDPTGKGGKIDVVLEKAGRAIACEIAITTTIDHEVGNVSKCLKAGFQHVAVISPSTDRLEKISTAVRACLTSEEAARVLFMRPDDFIAHLQELAIQDNNQPTTATPTQKQYGKYKVKSSVVNLNKEEIKAREESAFGMLADTMRKKK